MTLRQLSHLRHTGKRHIGEAVGMTRIKSALGARSDEDEANAVGWRGIVDELNARRRAATEGGAANARQRPVARGKLLARERAPRLVDPGPPFLEVRALA